MGDCCSATDRHFDRNHAERDLARYRTKGPDPTTSAILTLLADSSLESASLLDIGSGIGALSFEMLERGVESATLVDISGASLEAARSESVERNMTERISTVQGDAVDVAGGVDSADLVSLDRVLCCYPDVERLIAVSAAKAESWYAVSYPRSRWFVRLGVRFENLVRRLKGNPFRTFVHDPTTINDQIVSNGFELVDRSRTPAWEISLYARSRH